MKQTDLNKIVFNVAGLGLVVFLGGYMINSAVRKETIPSCSSRYGNGQQFALQGSSGPLSPIELQARLPTREWGLLTSARVVADKTGPYLQVALGPHEGVVQAANSSPDDEPSEQIKDGVGFIWHPQNLTSAHSACLSYRVYLPKDFTFEQRGTLPGLFAIAEGGDIDAAQPESGFVSRVGWEKNGGMGVNIRSPATVGMSIPARGTLWPVNRWVAVEQEVILNTAQKSDGTIRLWIDGELKINNSGLNLGANPGFSLSGVVADIGYSAPPAKTSRVTISPFILQWQ